MASAYLQHYKIINSSLTKLKISDGEKIKIIFLGSIEAMLERKTIYRVIKHSFPVTKRRPVHEKVKINILSKLSLVKAMGLCETGWKTMKL